MINQNAKMNNDLELLEYDAALGCVMKETDKVLLKSPLVIREYTKHLTHSHGKLIRANSVLICAEGENGMVHPNAVKMAAAIEILHLATLVHDDIIDNADLRRGVVTLQKKYGKKTAVICGDYLLCAALNLVSSITNKQNYLDINMPNYIGRVCIGELDQHINNFNLDISVYKYLKIISGKTAALFEASFFAGAVFSGVSEAECKRYKRLGFNIGMIFQLTDDCMDFDATVDEAKKPVQSDFEQGVITLPLIHAFKNKKELREKAAGSGISREEINDAVNLTDGLGFTKLTVNRYYKKSKKIIDELNVSEAKRNRLIMVLDKAARLV